MDELGYVDGCGSLGMKKCTACHFLRRRQSPQAKPKAHSHDSYRYMIHSIQHLIWYDMIMIIAVLPVAHQSLARIEGSDIIFDMDRHPLLLSPQ
jgi:hypothetical protein